MKHVVIGTAGHVDHGKTALVKALTGTDTDRLPEEKRRGLTIEPGFAALELPGGLTAGIVDVPGHEKFIANMLSGAAGVDLVLLCVDASEGFMPQTREHLDICALLGVQNGVLALTKADLLDETGILAAKEAVKGEIAGTFLENAPILPVSAKTGTGLTRLRAVLGELAAKTPEKPTDGPFRLHIDRSFTVEGFGTVVTGTVCSGAVRPGDVLALWPGGEAVRVRGLQTHGADAERLGAGQRAALNLAGISPAQAPPGGALAAPGALAPARWADGTLTLLEDVPAPLKSGSRLRFHHGTREILCRCTLRGREALEPGGTCPVRLRFERPVAAREGDRFVLRALSPPRTVGGGVLAALNPARAAPTEAGDPEARALELLAAHHAAFPLEPGMNLAELQLQVPAELLDALEAQKRLRRRGPYAFLPGWRPKYTPELARVRDKIELWYRRGGLTPGPNAALEAVLGPDASAGRQVLARLLRDGVLVPLDGSRRIHREALARAEQALRRLFAAAPQVTLAQYRDALGCGREEALRLLEFFDRSGLTRREGGGRILLEKEDDHGI